MRPARSRQLIFTLLCLGVLCALPAQAEEPLPEGVTRAAEATFGNDVGQLTYYTPAPFDNIKSSLDYGALIATNRQFVLSTALLFGTDLGLFSRLHLEFGPKVYMAFLEGSEAKNNVLALSGGVTARFDISRSWGLAAFGSFFYSPNVLTFGTANNLYDAIAGAEARLASQLVGVAGYRWLKFTINLQPNNKISNELFVGIRWQFR